MSVQPETTDTSRLRLRTAAVLGALAVAAGAFGAHALRGTVTDARLATFDTAAKYQLVHAVLLAALAHAPVGPLAPRLITAGTVVFSGTLYLLVLLDLPVLGAVTPVGGLLLIAGWLSLLLDARARS
jgi:uncharacterized membrane protein YgdD (TMEM256/DUF423 family)